jgi:hypothetical protein
VFGVSRKGRKGFAKGAKFIGTGKFPNAVREITHKQHQALVIPSAVREITHKQHQALFIPNAEREITHKQHQALVIPIAEREQRD